MTYHHILNRALAVCLCTISGLVASGSAGQAGELASRCERLHPGVENEPYRVQCYAEHMDDIRFAREQIGAFLQTATAIRGTARRGTEATYECGVSMGRQEVEPSVLTDGTCSAPWNDWVRSRNRYLELHCALHYGSLDDEVRRNRDDALAHWTDYDACFTAHIPEQYRRESFKDRESFVAELNRRTREFNNSGQPGEFLDLQKACDALLRKIARDSPDLIGVFDLRCN
ncbi:hypothetical protein [Rhodovulum euryhalinum]|uniref:Uncharacterized protein n=1 Tax=Rhodovulum euryhalinum TaxID=35805 RepID=A0A4R2KBG2_9RHOB|nr:hypothetical protein [Rhodovulum euryhalinum]TCO69387.1 hypothetical protein EV655_11516 [Rhodovulum euryhalinum]